MADWIPCKDRLPTENGEYLCSLKDGILHDIVILYYVADPRSFIEGEEDECGWYRYNEHAPQDIVIAWQPLPEPYKEQNNVA